MRSRRSATASRCTAIISLAALAAACAAERVQSSTKVQPPVAPAVKDVAAKEASPPPPQQLAVCPKLETSLPDIMHEDFDVEVPDLVDPSGEVMTPLYEKMALLLRGKAKDHIRIGMYGDSNMTMDFITGRIRRDLQLRFGDGGHGYVALAKPWGWYHHMDVKHDLSKKSWIAFAVSTAPAADHLIGFAGIAAQSLQPGALTLVATADEGAPIGTTASRFELYYLKRKGAGTFKIVLDSKKLIDVDAASETTEAGFVALETEDAPHELAFVTTSKFPVRLFGATLERGSPTFIVDSLGVGALSTAEMVGLEDQELNRQMLAHRKYDLILDMVGSHMWNAPQLPALYETMIGTHRAAIPGLPIVMLSPPDTVQKPTSPHSDPRIVRVGELKKKIAAENKAAYWDFRAAMGGDRSILEFKKHQMSSNDLIHLEQKGGSYMGDRIVYAIWRDFMRWLEKHPEAGCDAKPAEVAGN